MAQALGKRLAQISLPLLLAATPAAAADFPWHVATLAWNADSIPPADRRLDVASYNVQFVTPDLPLLRAFLREFPGHKPNVAARAQAIGEALACFDVVALQETINDQRRREIFAAMEAAGRDCGKPSRLPSGRMFTFLSGPGLPETTLPGVQIDPDTRNLRIVPVLDDELALATRLPVVEVGELVYGAAADEDRLAAKGVLHARLARRSGQRLYDVVDVFVTHLQAGNDEAAIRRRQIEELARFIRQHSQGTTLPLLIMGDFNLDGGEASRRDPSSEYAFLQRSLQQAVAPRKLADLWLAANPAASDQAGSTKPGAVIEELPRIPPRRIDYVFLATLNGDVRPLAARRDFLPREVVIDGAPVGYLSDHAAVLARLAWPPTPSEMVVAQAGHAGDEGLHPSRDHSSIAVSPYSRRMNASVNLPFLRSSASASLPRSLGGP